MTHGSLFTGIGVFDLAAENEGFTNIFGCDNNPFCQLHYSEHYPKSTLFPDITTLESIPYVDVLSFGFPCQDASNAAPVKKNTPLSNSRTGLFYEAIRLIRHSKPKFIIAENVAAIANKQGQTIIRYEGFRAKKN
jgi:DNA (cytosine-5)-methyltransferase 1